MRRARIGGAVSLLAEALEEVLEWAPRVLKLIPVFKDLWGAVKAQDQGAIFAAQMEMQRHIREEQARAEFVLDDPDEVTSPGGS